MYKNANRCHPCHLVATRKHLISRQCCKVATVARVKTLCRDFFLARTLLLYYYFVMSYSDIIPMLALRKFRYGNPVIK